MNTESTLDTLTGLSLPQGDLNLFHENQDSVRLAIYKGSIVLICNEDEARIANSSHLYNAMFPFSKKYSKELPESIREDIYPQIINCVHGYLIGRKGNTIFKSDDSLIFKGTTERFPWNTNIFLSVDRGKFMIFKEDNRHKLIYEIYIPKSLFVFSFIAGIFGFVLIGIWVGIGAILWLGGMNLFIAVIRHQSMFDEIISEINQSFIISKSLPVNEKPHVTLSSDSTFLKATGLAIAVILISMVLAHLIL